MTYAPPTPPGWYPDDAPGMLRWWDGTVWTASTMPASPPAPAAPQPYPQVPEGTRTSTPWIWAVVAVPLATLALTVVQLVLMQQLMQQYLSSFALMTTDPYATDAANLSGLVAWSNGMMLGTMLLSFVSLLLYGAGVLFAYLDHRDLGALGYQRRFHWAWNFLSPVYPIGRSVVVRRQAGTGQAPMWAAIAIMAATFLTPIVWMLAVFPSFYEQMFQTVTQFS
ncbi:DUF2510 domain-containing protein [Microbacterium bovistercoris]|uniref:DUF2510 domain-containing protein n=1 Tax=Microbacterium bovistercoris TaxID=2293570 RepID=A0A371NVF7_9MICO|nr:DUF2510 domain-containing protein [Microbacterium bovistercoris]REJ06593.1 DUF2510 domain-containing protein [Microbacterium bovistercoris]